MEEYIKFLKEGQEWEDYKKLIEKNSREELLESVEFYFRWFHGVKKAFLIILPTLDFESRIGMLSEFYDLKKKEKDAKKRVE